jgi:hypothetical protein
VWTVRPDDWAMGGGSLGQPGNVWRWAGAGIVDVGWATGAEPSGGGRGSRATVRCDVGAGPAMGTTTVATAVGRKRGVGHGLNFF